MNKAYFPMPMYSPEQWCEKLNIKVN